MSITTTNSAETWEKIYSAFKSINFVSYDYYTIKQSLINYLQLYYSESFNNFIETTNLMAYIETFAYVAELLAYRVDMNAHENFITTAERKSSILKLAKFLSYSPSRNLPARGLVKINTVSTSQSLLDSQGNNIKGMQIVWNDPNNPNWKEQFMLAMSTVLQQSFGSPLKSYDVGDVTFELYSFNNSSISFTNRVHSYTINYNSSSYNMEITSADLDENGVLEKAPDDNYKMNIVYANDGLGDASDNTGFMMYTKQGILTKIDYTFENSIPDRYIDISLTNINDTDVWLNEVDSAGKVMYQWSPVDVLDNQNIYFNTQKNKKKFQISSLEDDSIRLIFGNGDYGEIPVGSFNIWVRQSANTNLIIPKSVIKNEPMGFGYSDNYGNAQTFTLSYSLTSTIQNSSESETIDHIRNAAPNAYYSQNRMVNGQDYNTYPLKDPSVLKIKTINRTFAGQPKYLDWNDASGKYQNTKLFGDDLRIYYDMTTVSQVTSTNSRTLIDDVLTPILSNQSIVNLESYIGTQTNGLMSSPFDSHVDMQKIISQPRTHFLERLINKNDHSTLEKTVIQGKLDKHYYGEYSSTTTISGIKAGVVKYDADYNIYDPDLARTVDGVVLLNGGVGNGLQATVVPSADFSLTYSRYRDMVGSGSIFYIDSTGLETLNAINDTSGINHQYTIECVTENVGGGATFTVTSNVYGYIGTLVSDDGVGFSNEYVSFQINSSDIPFVVGDAFVVAIQNGRSYLTPTNLMGIWHLSSTYVPGQDLTGNWTTGDDWMINIKRNDDLVNWTITYRVAQLVIESPTTKFWYNNEVSIIDSSTQRKVMDQIIILKANLDKLGFILDSNKAYDVIGRINHPDGTQNLNALSVMPTDFTNSYFSGDGKPDNPLELYQFVDINNDYVYFKQLDTETHPTSVPSSYKVSATTTVKKLFSTLPADTYTTKVGTVTYYKKIGREAINFLWTHYVPNTNAVDPSPTNLMDMYILTKGYYNNHVKYLNDMLTAAPAPETTTELKNAYGSLLTNRMTSDTVIMHAANFKLLFGDKAAPELRGKFVVIKNPSSTLTDEQLKYEVLNVINGYFIIDDWDFGNTLYVQKLNAAIHAALPNDIDSVVMVPTFSNNYFGDLLIIESGIDEIIQSAATINNIQIVTTYNPSIIKQK